MYLVFKRACEVVLSFIALIILSPVLLITAIAVKLDSPGPVIFKQDRLGRGGKVFKIYKIRTTKSRYLNALQ